MATDGSHPHPRTSNQTTIQRLHSQVAQLTGLPGEAETALATLPPTALVRGRYSRDIAEMQPRCSRDAAKMQPRCSRDAAELALMGA